MMVFSGEVSGRVSAGGGAALVSVAVVSAAISVGVSEASGAEVPILGTWLLRQKKKTELARL